ncbi:MAG: RNA polymerase sigma-70 factor [Tannerella sp.]|jgi:RNA polymerase sigma-70 factor (ECF subfamily)|nr:RNA polymerase sigma-70 factor [Tannerella sp.]
MDKQDVKLFESLFQQMQPRLFAFCCKYVEDKELARDFVQECFISLWENFGAVEHSHESYLFTSVRNRCLSYIRSRKVHAEYEEAVNLRIRELEIHPEMPGPLTDLYLKELNEILHRSIEKLPGKCKRIFRMSRYRGLKNQEIADQLNISVRTVEAQIYNALKILKEDLKDYLPGRAK